MRDGVRPLGIVRAYLQSAGTAYVLFSVGVALLWCPPVALAVWAAAATDFLVEPLVFRGAPVVNCPRCGRETPAAIDARHAFHCRRCGVRLRLVGGRAYAY